MIYNFRLLIDLLYVLAIYIGFMLGQEVGMKYMFTDWYIARLYCGFIGVAVILAIFSKIKGSLMFLLKATSLYAVATKSAFGEAVKGTFKKFPHIVGVEVITKLLTEATNDVRDALMEDDNGHVTKLFPILEGLPFASVINILAKYYAKSFTYVDECILAYSFALDKPLKDSIKDAFVQFLKNAHVIMAKLVLTNLIMAILNIVTGVISFMFYLHSFVLSFHGVIMWYVIFRVVVYVLDDALVSPLLLQSVISDYVDDLPTASEQLEADMDKLILGDDDDDVTSDGKTPMAEEAVDATVAKLMELPAVKRLLEYSDHKRSKSKVKQEEVSDDTGTTE